MTDRLPAPPSAPEGPKMTELEQMAATIAAAHAEVKALRNGKRWQMRIPAEPLSDSDLVITAALSVADELLDRLRAALHAATAPQEGQLSAELAAQLVRELNDPPIALTAHPEADAYYTVSEPTRNSVVRSLRPLPAAPQVAQEGQP